MSCGGACDESFELTNPDNIFEPGIVEFTPGSKEVRVLTMVKPSKRLPDIIYEEQCKRPPRPLQPQEEESWRRELFQDSEHKSEMFLKEHGDDKVSFVMDDIIAQLLEAKRAIVSNPVLDSTIEGSETKSQVTADGAPTNKGSASGSVSVEVPSEGASQSEVMEINVGSLTALPYASNVTSQCIVAAGLQADPEPDPDPDKDLNVPPDVAASVSAVPDAAPPEAALQDVSCPVSIAEL